LPKLREKLPEESKLIDVRSSLFVHTAIGMLLLRLNRRIFDRRADPTFLGNWRSTCIIAVSIPFDHGLIILYMIGETIN
jgi:hypothetical protein